MEADATVVRFNCQQQVLVEYTTGTMQRRAETYCLQVRHLLHQTFAVRQTIGFLQQQQQAVPAQEY